VDLVVEPGDRRQVEELLAALGFMGMPLPGPDLHAARYDEAEGRLLWLHVQFALRVAGAELPARAVLAEAGGQRPRQPSDRWLLWILLLRALVDKGELPERHRPHVEALARRWEGGPDELVGIARRHGLVPDEIVALAATGDWDGLLARRPPRPPARRSRLRGARALARGLRGVRRPRGLSVAIIGPDGAGKSTLLEALAGSLPLPVYRQYMGLTGGRLRKVGRLRVPGLVFFARAVILWSRYLRGAYHRARGDIVLFERYTLDGAVPSGIPLRPAARMSRRVLRRICPLPDLVLLLDASGQTMYTRSGEYGVATLDGWRDAYRLLRETVPQLEVLDAERPAYEVRRDAESRIWRRYAELRGQGPASTSRKR
jgi:thymidylate kinase